MEKRRPSLAYSSPIVTGRRLSTDVTPVITTPVADDTQSRRGSLRDLGIEREVLLRLQLDFPSSGSKNSIRAFLATKKVDLFVSNNDSAPIISLDNLMDPVEAFEALIEAGLECLPVTTASLHHHHADGSVTFLPGHPCYIGLPRTLSTSMMSPRTTLEPSTPTRRPGAGAGQASPANSSRSGSGSQEISPLQFGSPIQADRTSSSNAMVQCPADCPHRNLVGWIDVRDLISCIIYVYKQPTDEDSLVNDLTSTVTPITSPFFGDFPPMPSSHHFTNRGLNGIVDIPIPAESSGCDDPSHSPRFGDARSPLASSRFSSKRSSLAPTMPALDEDSELPPQAFEDQDEPYSSTPSVSSSRSSIVPSPVSGKRVLSFDELPRGVVDSWSSTLKHGLRHFSPSSAITTSYLARRNQIKTVVASSSTLADICHFFALGAHCVPILRPETSNGILKIVTQQDIITFLYDNMDADPSMKEFFDSEIDSHNMGSPNILHIRDNIIGLDALLEMDENRKTCLAVVDEDGLLIGATSTKTILRLTKDRSHETMSEPLMHFIQGHDHELQPERIEDEERIMASHGTVAILDDNVLVREVLLAMRNHRVTRVFIVAENSYPLRIISLTDVLRAMFDIKY